MSFRQRRTTSRLFLILGSAALLVIVLIIEFAHRGPTASQKYLASLRAKGEKLTFSELVRAPQAHTQLTYSLIATRAGVLTNSSIRPMMPEYIDTRGSNHPRVLWRQTSPLPAAPGGKPLSWDDYNEAVRQFQAPVREFKELLNAPRPERESEINSLDLPRKDLAAIRHAAQWLWGAVISELQQGHLEEALDDIEALAVLANANGWGLPLANLSLQVDLSRLGLTATWQALQAPGWSDAQLARMQRSWDSVNLLDCLEGGLVCERAQGIRFWDKAKESSGKRAWNDGSVSAQSHALLNWDHLAEAFRKEVLFPFYKCTSMEGDELFYLQTTQEALEAVRAVKSGNPSVFRSYGTTNSLFYKLETAGPVEAIRYHFSLRLIPNFIRWIHEAVHCETLRQMTLTAIAIQRFQTSHRAPPPNLDALVPDLLREPTCDPMSGRVLIYRIGENNDWLLYSTGMDGQDDGGSSTPRVKSEAWFWGAPDAVWPRDVEDAKM